VNDYAIIAFGVRHQSVDSSHIPDSSQLTAMALKRITKVCLWFLFLLSTCHPDLKLSVGEPFCPVVVCFVYFWRTD